MTRENDKIYMTYKELLEVSKRDEISFNFIKRFRKLSEDSSDAEIRKFCEKVQNDIFSAKISRYSIGQSMRVECKESPVKIYKTAEDLEAEGLTEHIKTTDYNGETFEYDTYNKEIQDNIMRLRQNQYFDLDSWTDADYLSAYAEAVKVSKFHAIKTELFEPVCEDVKAFVESYNYHDCDGMIDYFESAVTLKRIEICDLLLACLAAKELSNDGGEKWIRLYKNLKEQLDKLDAQLDEIS